MAAISGDGGSAPDIIDTIRSSCRAAVASSPNVFINEEAIAPFIHEVLAKNTPTRVKPFDLPLLFDNLDDEINLWTLLQLINFGSGYRHELKAETGGGAWETMVRGVLAMHLMGCKITADFMSRIEKGDITQYFGIEPTVEVQIMPAVYETKPGPLNDLVDMLVQVINDAGNALQNRRFDSFASFFRANATPRTKPKVGAFVRRLVDTFAGFRDVTSVRGVQVHVCKKAQLCAAYMHRKFAISAPELFDFEDVSRLTIMADNVVAAVLRASAVIRYSDDLAAQVDARKPIPAGELDTDIRAASIVACERIVLACHSLASGSAVDADGGLKALATLNEAELDEFLWNHGKEPHLRVLDRHATKDTFFY